MYNFCGMISLYFYSSFERESGLGVLSDMRKWLKRFISIFMLVFSLLSSFMVNAEDGVVSVESTISVIENSAEIANICVQANNSVDINEKILSYSSSNKQGGLLKFNNRVYNDLDSDEKYLFMETALSAVSSTSLNAKNKNKVYNFIAGQDTPVSNTMKYLQSNANADFLEAKKIFDPFSGIIGTALGVLCVLIFLFCGFSILFDVFYLVIPGVQAILERGEETKKPMGVSREAYSALRDAEKDTEYKNVMTIYFKRRIGLLIVMCICIGYLISGKIFDVIAYVIDAFT